MQALIKWNTPFNWFFILYALAGFMVLGDYGIPLDELTQRHIGLENAKYISGTGNPASVAAHGFFGPVLEVINYASEQLIYNHSLGDKLMLRHIILFVIFLLSIRAFYVCAKYMAKVPMAAGLATAMYALYPALFAHAHYNSKDTFFLSLVVFILYFLVLFAKTGKLYHLIFLAAITGISATVRLNGIFILFALCVAFMVSGKSIFVMRLKRVGIIIGVFMVSFYLFYPFLWIVNFKGFSQLLHYVTSNPWPWNTLAAGEDIVAGHLPWWYLFGWMGVTIPLLTLALFLFGLVRLVQIKKTKFNLVETVILCVLAIPLLYFLLFRPTIYNSWRHVQFIFVPISLLVVFALNHILRLKFASYTAWIMGAYVLFTFALWHPYGHSYFNEIYAVAYKPATWDQDYWGLSANQGLKWVVENDKRDSIVISSFTESPELNAFLLPEKDQKRLHFIHQQGAGDYEVEVKRGRNFSDLKGTVVFTAVPLKDTLVRVVKLR
ncbi:MAG: glycosyltransferase family 39 protein [Bacteroidia bacterium]|nr:glycosyltransferase family 39 protein [Bacteroidia bacterium]